MIPGLHFLPVLFRLSRPWLGERVLAAAFTLFEHETTIEPPRFRHGFEIVELARTSTRAEAEREAADLRAELRFRSCDYRTEWEDSWTRPAETPGIVVEAPTGGNIWAATIAVYRASDGWVVLSMGAWWPAAENLCDWLTGHVDQVSSPPCGLYRGSWPTTWPGWARRRRGRTCRSVSWSELNQWGF